MRGDCRLRLCQAVNYAYSLFQEHSLSSGVDVTSDKLMPWFWYGTLEEQWAE